MKYLKRIWFTIYLAILFIPAVFVAVWNEVIMEMYDETGRIWHGKLDDHSWKGGSP